MLVELVCHVETIVTTFSVLQLLFKTALMKPPSYNNLFQIMQKFFKKVRCELSPRHRQACPNVLVNMC